jgi:Tol biopolymer transport system component
MKVMAVLTTGGSGSRRFRIWFLIALLVAVAGIGSRAAAGQFQLLTTVDPAQGPPSGGGGDSLAPTISPDGRYVLFSSLANNLVLLTNGLPLPVQIIPKLNVFLHDRTNQSTTLVSVNGTGAGGGNSDSLPAGLSADARFVLFESSASDLVPGDTNIAADIFLRDLATGTTLLVSANTNGGAGNRGSRGSVMTPDGRYVAFVSAASDLVAGDTNGLADVFLRDLQSGTTTLVSVGAMTNASSPAGGSSEYPDITPDGRYVAFYSTASNLVAGAVNLGDIYVRDLVSGTTTWASSYALTAVQLLSPATTNVVCYNHLLSTNGQFLVYQASAAPLSGPGSPGVVLRYNMYSGATDIISTNATVGSGMPEDVRSLDMTPDGRFVAFVANTNASPTQSTCVLVWDDQTGAITLASGDLSNSVPTNSICVSPSLSPDGRFVLFLCSSNLVTNALAGDLHLYQRDLQAATTTLVDTDTNGFAPVLTLASAPRMSADGRLVAFECPDNGLVPADLNRSYDIVVRDLTGGTVELISARDATLPTLTPNGPSTLFNFSVSTNGSYVAFASEADNLVSGDTNSLRDIFRCDLVHGTNVLVSVATNGASADGISSEAAISGDGRYVVFTSAADNLVAGDSNGARDVFVRDLVAGTTALVSVNSAGTGPGNGASYSPQISADGRYVFFHSLAQNLTFPPSGYENLFVRDLQRSTNYALTFTTSSIYTTPVGAMTPDGRFIAYCTDKTSFNLCVWSTLSTTLVYSNTPGGQVDLAVSPNGNRIAYRLTASGALFVIDRVTATTWSIGAANSVHSHFSGDGRFLVYAAPSSKTNQVYLYDLQYSTNYLVSHAYNSTAGAYGVSDWPEISSDGRFVAYRSAAPNIVPGDTNGVPDIFLYDRLNATTTLMSVNQYGTAAGSGRSGQPVLSGDGRMLVFLSWASDMVAQDFNLNGDLFACQLYDSSPIPLFSVSILGGVSPAQGPWLVWPVVQGRSYTVQFKNSVLDASWQTLSGGVTIMGSQAYLNDSAAGSGPRLYRVVAY